ncbi:flagellar export chaperone FlgN [Leifsonia sp. L25]|uniref:flagellar export chaperone FlgN n=1 Tax=Leifsonia sp. L25 TaxID=3423957 RepID=UPI003D6858C2
MRTSTHEEVGSDMAASELSAQLWKERELLELLLFKLEEEQLLLIAGKSRWISHATREVEQVIERMRAVGLARTVEVASLAEEWGIGQDATLRELATAAPDGIWSDIFRVPSRRHDGADGADRRGARHERASAARGRALDAGNAELSLGRRRRAGRLRRERHGQPGRHGTLLRHGGLTG